MIISWLYKIARVQDRMYEIAQKQDSNELPYFGHIFAILMVAFTIIAIAYQII